MSTGNITVGTGKTVHAAKTQFGKVVALCGAGNVHEGQIRPYRSRSFATDRPITCKRCLALMDAHEANKTGG